MSDSKDDQDDKKRDAVLKRLLEPSPKPHKPRRDGRSRTLQRLEQGEIGPKSGRVRYPYTSREQVVLPLASSCGRLPEELIWGVSSQ